MTRSALASIALSLSAFALPALARAQATTTTAPAAAAPLDTELPPARPALRLPESVAPGAPRPPLPTPSAPVRARPEQTAGITLAVFGSILVPVGVVNGVLSHVRYEISSVPTGTRDPRYQTISTASFVGAGGGAIMLIAATVLLNIESIPRSMVPPRVAFSALPRSSGGADLLLSVRF